MTLEFSHLSEKYFLTKLQSRLQVYVILTYLQRKSVNYNLFMLFETEKLHLKTFCMGTPFSIAE